MARDRVDRSNDPGASEFAGDPDDPRVGIVSNDTGQPNALLNAAYWSDPADPGSDPADLGNIGDTTIYRA